MTECVWTEAAKFALSCQTILSPVKIDTISDLTAGSQFQPVFLAKRPVAITRLHTDTRMNNSQIQNSSLRIIPAVSYYCSVKTTLQIHHGACLTDAAEEIYVLPSTTDGSGTSDHVLQCTKMAAAFFTDVSFFVVLNYIYVPVFSQWVQARRFKSGVSGTLARQN